MHTVRRVSAWGRSLVVVSTAFLALLLPFVPPVDAIVLPPQFQEAVVVPAGPAGLSFPDGMAFLPDGRILVIQQGGQIRLVVNGTLVAGTLLTMPEVELVSERGLVGIAVDPDFPGRPFIYVFYSDKNSDNSHLARYTVAGDLRSPTSTNLTIDPTTKVLLINQIPDVQPIHNSGTLRFAADKTLYVSVGDSDSCGAQDLTQLKGKILRIKVDDTITPLDLTSMVPADNPFATSANVNTRLVWAYGLRNPFRFSIDPTTGLLFIADVGESRREEVDHTSPGGGDNFGWPYLEGSLQFKDCNGSAPDPTGLVPPILEYAHSGQPAYAVIAGPVYQASPGAGNGRFPPNLDGVFFVSDYYLGILYALRFNCVTGTWDKIAGATSDLWATGLSYGVSDMTIGPDGSLYYVAQGVNGVGSLRKIVYTGAQLGASKTYTVPPCRVLETRDLTGANRMAANSCRAIRVTGSALDQGAQDTCGIPPTATAVFMNIVAVNPTSGGFLSVFPFGWTPPLTSTLNFGAGQTIAHGLLMPVCNAVPASACEADLVLQNGPSATDIVIDVTGYTLSAP